MSEGEDDDDAEVVAIGETESSTCVSNGLLGQLFVLSNVQPLFAALLPQ